MADPLASSRAGAPHRPKISPILGQSHGHGDRLERPHPSRMNTKTDLGLASAAPSSPASAANRVRVTESLSAQAINRLLQQNLPQPDSCSTANIAYYSIISSARIIKDRGTSRPSAVADFKLTTSSNLTGAWTGSSFGFAPCRTRST